MLSRRLVLAFLLTGSSLIGLARSAASSPDGKPKSQSSDSGFEFFETKIRPVLVQECYRCHSPKAKSVKGGLLLDTREGFLKGGDSGPALVPGKPEASRLLKALRYTDEELRMPPRGKLSDAVIADFEKWIALGAPDPRSSAATNRTESRQDRRSHWSFQPIRNPQVP